MEENLAARKRTRRGKDDKKKRIEEIDKPRGLARGLLPEKILAGQLFNEVLYFLVKWRGCDEYDVVPGRELGEAYPDFVIGYYEGCVPFSVRHRVANVRRVAPELPPTVETHLESTSEAMDISQEVLSESFSKQESESVESHVGEDIISQVPLSEDTPSLEVPVN